MKLAAHVQPKGSLGQSRLPRQAIAALPLQRMRQTWPKQLLLCTVNNQVQETTFFKFKKPTVTHHKIPDVNTFRKYWYWKRSCAGVLIVEYKLSFKSYT